MTILEAAVLGVVQGLAEFLPISSSAHLVLVPRLLNWPEPSLSFDVFLHLATTAALIAYFWNDILKIGKAWMGSFRRGDTFTNPESRLGWLIIIGTLPAVLAGILFMDFFENLFSSPLTVSSLLIVTGVLLWGSEKLSKQEKGLQELNLLDSVAIGIAQALAIAPGISRSGATIVGGRVRGFNREAAARFSFLLAIPVTIGAGVAQLPQASVRGAGDFAAFAVGFVAAAVFGYLSIKYLLAYLRQGKLYVFAYYCWIVGIGSLAWIVLSG
jgi:undecaprenyl-diphosphatase